MIRPDNDESMTDNDDDDDESFRNLLVEENQGEEIETKTYRNSITWNNLRFFYGRGRRDGNARGGGVFAPLLHD